MGAPSGFRDFERSVPAAAMADKLLRLRDATGISYVTVSARFLDDFAPVLELLSDR